MKDILFASHNRGKYDELVDDFANEGINLIFYADAGLPEIYFPENSEILAENAFEKAAAAAAQTGYYSLGDDSGIFISALDGFPGVHSRRWTGSDVDDKYRNEKIIELLKDEEDRSVHLISRFSLVDPNGKQIYKTVVNNEFTIADSIYGSSGFGYDSILIPSIENVLNSSLDKERKFEILINKYTIADCSQEEKNAINNRGRIAKEIKNALNNLGGENG